jgi:hypothetical protein
MLQERLPDLLLASGRRDEIEVVRDVDPADDAPETRLVLVEREQPRQRLGGIGGREHAEGPPRAEGAQPLRLPLRRQEDRTRARLGHQGVPPRGLDRVQAGQGLDLHV